MCLNTAKPVAQCSITLQLNVHIKNLEHLLRHFVPLLRPLTLYRLRARPSPYRTVNTFHLGYKNQSVYVVSGRIPSLFSDRYETHKYFVGRRYKC